MNTPCPSLATAMVQCRSTMTYDVPENLHSANALVLHAPVYCGAPPLAEDGFLLAQKLAAAGLHFYLTPQPDQSQWYARNYPDLYEMHGEELETSYSMLADDASRRSFAAVVQALVTGNLGYLSVAPYQQYEHPVVHIRPGDYVIDGGMFSLDDTRRFARRACADGAEGRVLGFEPEPEQFSRIQAELAEDTTTRCIEAFQLGLGAENKDCNIVFNGAGSYLTAKDNPSAAPCRVVALDSFVKERSLPKVDVIKMDIEGCEKDALLGATETIRRFTPRLMISAYHKKEDLFTLPQTIRNLCPEYKLYFSAHYMLTGEYLFYASMEKNDA